MISSSFSSQDRRIESEQRMGRREEFIISPPQGEKLSLRPPLQTCKKINDFPDSTIVEKIETFRQQLIQSSGEMSIREWEEKLKKSLCVTGSPLLFEDQRDRYGPKHRNLEQLHRIVHGLNISGTTVPFPRGCSTDSIEHFLRESEAEIFSHWESLGFLYRTFQQEEMKEPFLTLPEVIERLHAIQEGIKRAFHEASEGKISFDLPEEFTNYLQDLQQRGHYLMVRSSGAEDGTHVANAGGNLSKSYIAPERSPLLKAMGEVVASYFTSSSLQNRIHGEPLLNPFLQPLSIGVTTQELIGESVGLAADPHDIPISMVLFTNEPLYVGDEQFRVMRLSATYGHGEGVVGGSEAIGTDTFLLLQSEYRPQQLYILHDIHAKTHRLAPMRREEGIILQRVENPDGLIHRSCLEDEMIQRLYHLGIVVELCYGGIPTDMEIVMKGNEIYLVQARPIIRQKLIPTYLDLGQLEKLSVSPLGRSLHGETVVSGKASLVVIDHSFNILAENTLEEAEHRYNPHIHRLIITHTREPENSHPVVNFSSLGVSCLYIKDKRELEELLDTIDEDHPLVICMQNGTIYGWDASIVKPQQFIREGFITHPAHIALSLPLNSFPDRVHHKTLIPKNIKESLLTIRSANNHTIALERLALLRERLSSITIEETISSLKEIYVKKKIVIPIIESQLSVIHGLSAKVQRAFDEVEKAFQRADEKERLRPLFHLKVLETLLLGHPTLDRTAVGSYSMIDLSGVTNDLEALIHYQVRLSHSAHLSDLLNGPMRKLSSIHQRLWREFLLSLEPLIEDQTISNMEVERFKEFIGLLRDTGVLSAWMIFEFHSFTKARSSQETFTKMILSIDPNSLSLIQVMKKRIETIHQLRQQSSHLAHPATFDRSWHQLSLFLKEFSANKLCDHFRSYQWKLSFVAKLSAYRAMEELVDLLDESIKTMKRSSHFLIDEKFYHFTTMVDEYSTLMEEWAFWMIPRGALKFRAGWNLQLYFSTLYTKRSNTSFNQYEFSPSPEFSVAAAMLGSETNYSRHLPRTVEDLFTLTHQNLLFMISLLHRELISDQMIDDSLLPARVREDLRWIDSNLSSLQPSLGNGYPTKIAMKVEDDNSIFLRYNIPLNNHSGTIELHYRNNGDECSLQGSLLGEARERWIHSKAYLEGLSAMGLITLIRPIRVNGQELLFSLKLEKREDIEVVFAAYRILADYSMMQGVRVNPAVLMKDLLQKGGQSDLFQSRLTDFFLKQPNVLAETLYDQYLERALSMEMDQTISPVSVIYSSKNNLSKLLLEFILLWATTPEMSTEQRLEEGKRVGVIEEYDESLLRRLLPLHAKSGHNFIVEWISLQIEKEGYYLFLSVNSVIQRYVEANPNCTLLFTKIHRAINDCDHGPSWLSVMESIVEQGKGYEEATIILQHRGLSHPTMNLLNGLLKKGRMIEEFQLQYQRLRTELSDTMMAKSLSIVLERGFMLKEAEEFYREKISPYKISFTLNSENFFETLMKKLLQRGSCIEEIMKQCDRNIYLKHSLHATLVTIDRSQSDGLYKELTETILTAPCGEYGRLFAMLQKVISRYPQPEIAADLLFQLGQSIANERKKELDEAFVELLQEIEKQVSVDFVATITGRLLNMQLEQSSHHEDHIYLALYDFVVQERMEQLEDVVASVERYLQKKIDTEYDEESREQLYKLSRKLIIQGCGYSLVRRIITSFRKIFSDQTFLFLLIDLVERGEDEGMGLSVIHERVKSGLPIMQYGFEFDLLKMLIQKGKAFDLARDEVERILTDSNDDEEINYAVFTLIELLDQKVGEDLVKKALLKSASKKYFGNLLSSIIKNKLHHKNDIECELRLEFNKERPNAKLTNVVLESQEYPHLIIGLIHTILECSSKQRGRTDEGIAPLIMKMVREGKEIALGYRVAKSFATHFHAPCRLLSLELFARFIEQGVYFDEAQEAVKRARYDEDPAMRKCAHRVLSSRATSVVTL